MRRSTALLVESRFTLPAIVLLGLLLRLAVSFVMPAQDFSDTAEYLAAGKALAAGEVMGATNRMPLYPLLIALAGGATGIKILDLAVSTLFIVQVFAFARDLTDDRRTALLAAGMTAVYPHFAFYAAIGLSETTYMALLVGAFHCLYRQRMAAGSVLLVLSILERPALDLLAPILIVMVSLLHRPGAWRRAGLDLAKYVVIYVVLMTPWWIHNHAKYGQFVRLNLGDGLIVYAGNNPLNRSGGGVANGVAGDDMDLTPFEAIADPIARNQAMKDAAVDYIRQYPGRFVEMMGVKFIRFWRLWPYAPQYRSPWIIALSLASYGIVLPLALFAVFGGGRAQAARLAPILALVVYLSLVHMVTIGSIRFRLPLEPFLIVLAAMAIGRMVLGGGTTTQKVTIPTKPGGMNV